MWTGQTRVAGFIGKRHGGDSLLELGWLRRGRGTLSGTPLHVSGVPEEEYFEAF
jgi:hypothetical protein